MITTMLALALLADPVTIISGVQIGDTPETVNRVVPGRLIDVVGKPGFQMINEGGRTISFCNGRVISVQVIIGRDLHDFTDSVQDKESEIGDGLTEARHFRTAAGQISTISTEWDMGDGLTYSLKLTQTANGPLDVSTSLATERPPC